MKFTCLQENLVKGIQATGYLAQKATNLPVLNNVHLVVRTDGLVLSSTNLEAGVEHVIRGKSEEEGECLIPAKLLLDLVPLLVGGAITMESGAGGLIIKTETTNTTIRTTPTTEFPILPKIEQNTPMFIIAKTKLSALLGGVTLAAGKVEQRPQFNGVFIG